MMALGLAIATVAALGGYQGATTALQAMQESREGITPRKATWVGVGLIIWIAVVAFFCHWLTGR